MSEIRHKSEPRDWLQIGFALGLVVVLVAMSVLVHHWASLP